MDDLGLRLRPDVSIDDLAYALQAAGEGVLFRSLLPPGNACPAEGLALDHENQRSRPLALIAMALLAAFTDAGDGKSLRDVIGDLGPEESQTSARTD